MNASELTVGSFYRLNKEVGHEHQDHWFSYPQGMIVRLREVINEDVLEDYEVENEDGRFMDCRKIGERQVYLFDIPKDGMSDAFKPEDLEPASQDDVNASPEADITQLPFREEDEYPAGPRPLWNPPPLPKSEPPKDEDFGDIPF